MEKVIRRRRRLRDQAIREAGEWARSLKGRVAVILVGSYARGDFNQWSNIDLVIVDPSLEGIRVVDRLARISTRPGYEVIPLTPGELERLLEKRNPIAVDAVCNGVVLRDNLDVQALLDAYKPRLCGAPA